MFSTPIKSSSKPVKSRLGLKLMALFAGSFLAVFMGLLFWDLFLMLGERVIVDRAVANQPQVTAIDPKLESDLAKVLEYSDAQNTADIKNPFADSGGISGKSATVVGATAPSTTSAAKTAVPGATQNNPQRNQTPQNVAARTVQPVPNVNPLQPQIDTRNRLQLREEKIRLGMDAGPEAEVFAVDDLLPVGTVGGGDGKDEVMFYSQTACRVVSFPVGTRFYDGWLDSLRPEGVVFGYFDQYRAPGTRAWESSTVSKCAERNSALTLLDPPVTAGGGD